MTECPDFNSTKKCPRGKKCPLAHRLKPNFGSKSKKIFRLKSNQLKLKNIDDDNNNDNTNNNTEPILNVNDKQEFGASFISFEVANSLEKSKLNTTGYIHSYLFFFFIY